MLGSHKPFAGGTGTDLGPGGRMRTHVRYRMSLYRSSRVSSAESDIYKIYSKTAKQQHIACMPCLCCVCLKKGTDFNAPPQTQHPTYEITSKHLQNHGSTISKTSCSHVNFLVRTFLLSSEFGGWTKGHQCSVHLTPSM